MGSGASKKNLPDTLDEEAAKKVAGESWDKTKFDTFKGTDGLITKERLLEAAGDDGKRRMSLELKSPSGTDLTKDMSFSSSIK
jgi:hypothetical protein